MSKFRVVTFNAEGMSEDKAQILSTFDKEVLCLQETHKTSAPPTIPGFDLIIHHPSPVHGSALYARDKTIVSRSKDLTSDGIEILILETEHMNIISVYKPPPTPFTWPADLEIEEKAHLILGDFNSHNTIWGYENNNKDGEAVEEWALTNGLTLIHNAKDKPSFHSARWNRGYNPDLVFVSSRYHSNFEKHTSQPIPKSQHRPILVNIKPVLRPIATIPRPRFNLRKANWENFTMQLEQRVSDIRPVPECYEEFQHLVWETSKHNIPRGCRKEYIPGLSKKNKLVYQEYKNAYNSDPFAERTVELGETLMALISGDRKERWAEIITNIDMTHNSKKAWMTIRKLDSDKAPPKRTAAVTPNNVAHQLLLNGKPLNRERRYLKKMKEDMEQAMNACDNLFEPFTIEELNEALKHLKPGKAAGLDGILAEAILHFGDRTKDWLLSLFNACASTYRIPKIWRRAKVVALLKPEKNPEDPKSYRPISLLCTLYKVYERMILGRISSCVEDQLSPDQAGFRPGRSCCGQVLNLTQFIEDGFEERKITGAVFVDLSAAYDTVNHRALMLKVAKTIKNTPLVRMIGSLLTNRRYYVEMDGKNSRWRNQKNGLPQGSVLAPTLFNIYTNDQPTFANIRRFIYADDLCLATQAESFVIIQERLSDALKALAEYYIKWSLNANPSKTQVCSFHLKHRFAKTELEISWNNERLTNKDHPVYLGVTLDRTLSFKKHVLKLKKKLSSRTNLLSKLANSSWGADPNTLRSTALALCYSTAEYCAPVWSRSCHAGKVDPELNSACRTITGTLRATPLPTLHRLSGIAPPSIRRDTTSRVERFKQLNEPQHPLHNHQQVVPRLKSRRSFATVEPLHPNHSATSRKGKWIANDTSPPNDALPPHQEHLPKGTSLCRKDWVALNRARSKVGKTKKNMYRWGLANNPECPCGEPTQTMDHILRGCPQGPVCTDEDLRDVNHNALTWIQHWRDKI